MSAGEQPRAHRHPRWPVLIVSLVITIAVALTVAWVIRQRSGAGEASLSLNPADGAAGSVVALSGSGFPAHSAISITWDGSPEGMPAARADARGAFQLQLTIPSHATPGTYSIAAAAGNSDAEAILRVVDAVPAPTPAADIWRPELNTSWQWQLDDPPVDQRVEATMFDIDLFDNDAEAVAALHAKGRSVVCYVSAGSFEDWRPDAGLFPESVLGNALDGWPGERWLDIRRIDLLGPIIAARLDLCKSRGFDAVEPDNVDGYSNDTGFPLTAADQLRYNRWLADQAHARGLAIALKNNGEQAPDLLPVFDFALVEQCYVDDDCDRWLPFVAAGKAVFIVEYDLPVDEFCPQANASNFNAMRKHLELDAWREPCR